MPLLKRRANRSAEIPTSSMADIAFLLLVFFLVVTTIDVDKGIYMELPPILDETPPEIRDRNLLVINVTEDSSGELAILVEDEFIENTAGRGGQLARLREIVIDHVTNMGEDPQYSENPDKAIVSFKTERDARYELYIDVLDEIKAAYIDIRNGYARQLGSRDYADYQSGLNRQARDRGFNSYQSYRGSLTDEQKDNNEGTDASGQPVIYDEVAETFPLKISLAEPDGTGPAAAAAN